MATLAGAAGLYAVPEVKMIRPCRSDERAELIRQRPILGLASPRSDLMYLKAGQDRREMLDTIGHEIMHFVQHFKRLPPSEAAAIRVGRETARLLA